MGLSNQIRVVKYRGADGILGYIDPKINMVTNQGTILTVQSGNLTVDVGVGSGSVKQRFYPHQLNITYAHATGVWSFPSGDGSWKHTHSGIFPNSAVGGVASGMYYSKAGTPTVFSRPNLYT